MKSKTLLMYSIIGAIIATAGTLAVSGAVCEPDCVQYLSSLITGSQPLQQPQASPQQTPTANPTPSLSIGGSQTAEKSKPSGNSGGTFGPIILSSPKPPPSKQCNQFKETCYWSSRSAGQAYSDQQCQAKFGYAYHYDYRMNGCVPLGGSQPLQHAQSQTTQNTTNYDYQNRQCVARYGQNTYYDATKNACLPKGGSWANYSTSVDNNQQCQAQFGQGSYYDRTQNRCLGGSVESYSVSVDPNVECQKRYWWLDGVYFDSKNCQVQGGWKEANKKLLEYQPNFLGGVDYKVHASATVKGDIEESFNTGEPVDTKSKHGTIPYDDSPGNVHITAQLWFWIKPNVGNNLDMIIHLDDANIDGQSCGNKEIHGSAVYHPEDAAMRGSKSIAELKDAIRC